MNSLQTILLHLDASDHLPVRLAVAAALAEGHDASVTAMYAVMPSAMQAAAVDESDSLFLDAALQLDQQRLERTRQMFDAAAPGPRVRWARLDKTPLVSSFVRQALVVDLLVLGQHDAGAAGSQATPADFVESVIIDSGKPALVIPCAGVFAEVGRTVLVAWKPTRESARALSAALPLLKRARQVHVASWDDDPHEVQHWLLRHGIDAQMHRETGSGQLVGDAMLSLAADFGADLMVMGCYGHSRVRELVLGGASRTVLSAMTLPVFMAH